MLLLIEDTRQQQAAFQYRNLLFDITFGLQRAVEPVFHSDIALHQLVAVFRRLNQLFAKLMVNFKLLLDQRVILNPRGLLRRDRFLCGFLGEGQPLAVHRFLQQLQLMFQPVAVGGHVITLFLQRILQHSIAFQALTLLFDLRIQQGLLRQQQPLLRRAQRLFARRGAVETVTNLL